MDNEDGFWKGAFSVIGLMFVYRAGKSAVSGRKNGRVRWCSPGQHFWVRGGERCGVCGVVIMRDASGREISD